MYRCCRCGMYFDEPRIYTWKESRGEYWGVPCEEEMSEEQCPHCCSDDFEEVDEDEEV